MPERIQIAQISEVSAALLLCCLGIFHSCCVQLFDRVWKFNQKQKYQTEQSTLYAHLISKLETET
jgi:hypothetical protein